MREKRKITFQEATSQFVHRFTCEHIPAWARSPVNDGSTVDDKGKPRFYAPQYATDQEWYEKTFFYGESEMATKNHCYSTNPSWPLGKEFLKEPFRG